MEGAVAVDSDYKYWRSRWNGIPTTTSSSSPTKTSFMSSCLVFFAALVASIVAQSPCPASDAGPMLPECDSTAAAPCATNTDTCRPSPPLPPNLFTGTNDGCCFPPDAIVTTTTTTVASAVTATTTAACNDLLNPLTGVSDCPSRAALCRDSTYNEVMIVQCRRTCGYCGNTTSTNSTCADLLNPTTGVSDCPARRALCNNTVYAPLMAIQCRATCGLCTSG